jgi:hypothetical protein
MNRCVSFLLLLDIAMFLDAVEGGAHGVSHLGSGEGSCGASYGGSGDGTTGGGYGFGLELVVVLLIPRFNLRLGPGVGGDLRSSRRGKDQPNGQKRDGEASEL